MARISAKLLLILFLIPTCCAKDPLRELPAFKDVDPRIEAYYERFYKETGMYPVGITAGFSDLETNIAGECVTNGPFREIIIDNQYWLDIGDYDGLREQLVYHELGHCLLGLDHLPNMYGNIPLSIMNPVGFDEGLQLTTYKQRHSDYVKALIFNSYITYP